MKITITRGMLATHHAHPDLLSWLDMRADRYGYRIPWNPVSQINFCVSPATSKFWSFLRDKRVLPQWSYAGMQLGGAELPWGEFRDADFRGANLSGADLSHADLRGANLYMANLRGASLRDAKLEHACLVGAARNPDDHSIPGWTVVGGRLQRAKP